MWQASSTVAGRMGMHPAPRFEQMIGEEPGLFPKFRGMAGTSGMESTELLRLSAASAAVAWLAARARLDILPDSSCPAARRPAREGHSQPQRNMLLHFREH